MDEAVDEGDDTRGIWEDLAPVSERLVGGHDDRFSNVMAARHDFEEQVGVPVSIGEIADLINLCGDAQDLWAAQTALDSAGAVFGSQGVAHDAGGGEEHAVAA
ncbi:MAG: hypothetical protein ACJATT_001281 [Myxococcota bacterium]|jgi:hypothetical protein